MFIDFNNFLATLGGRIDHAHHYNNPYRALDETLSLETAVLSALELVEPTETLIVVTADHSHVMTMGGQATPLGNPILGPDNKVSDIDGQPYSILLYGNGPGYTSPRTAPINISALSSSYQVDNRNVVHSSAVPRQWATHGGEDVPVYSLGPLATNYFSGVFDQSYIPHAIAYIACLGEFMKRCQQPYNVNMNNSITSTTNSCQTTSSNINVNNNNLPVIIASSVMSHDGNPVISDSAELVLSQFYTLILITWPILITIR